MSRLIRTSLGLALALALVGTSAVAQQASTVPANSNSMPQTTSLASQTASTPPVIKPGDRNCLRDTGSRIPAKPGECLPVAGRSYTGQELRNTGAIDTGRALQMLDPSITVRH